MRRAPTMLAICTIASALAFCSATEATSGGSSHRLSRRQAELFARAVNLRGADLPQFSVSTVHDRETAADRRLEHALRSCVGPNSVGSPGSTFAAVGSEGFGREAATFEQSVSSEVSIARIPSLVASKAQVQLRSAGVRACMDRYANRLLKVQKDPSVVRLGAIGISSLAPRAPGATASFGARITARIKVGVFDIHVYIDVLSFVHGSAEVTLLTSGAPRPFPASTEHQLFALLLRRAQEKRL